MNHLDPDFKKFLQLLVVLLCLVLGLAFVNQLYDFKSGVTLGLVNIFSHAIGAFCSWRFLRSPHISLWTRLGITGFFLGLLVGDFFFHYYYYFVEVGRPTPTISLLTEMGYKACNIFFIFGVLSALKDRIADFLKPWPMILPFLIVGPIALRISQPLMEKYHVTHDLVFLATESIMMLSSFLTFIVAMMVFMSARSLFWTTLTAGPSLFLLAGWSIRLEKLMGSALSFTIYEYVWTFGVLLASAGIFCFRHSIYKIETYSLQSLSQHNTKTSALVVAFLAILLVALFQHDDPRVIKFLTISTGVGILGSEVLRHFVVHQLKLFSKTLEAALTQDLLGQAVNMKDLSLPIELSESYQKTLESRMDELQDKIKREQVLEGERREALIAKQVAHDIRAPLSALEVVSSEADSISPDLKVLVQSAISRIREISRDLLKRSEEAKPESKTNVLKAIEEIVRECRTQTSYHKIEFVLTNRIGPTIDPIRILESDLKRVISNLMTNACEAIHGSGKIEVILAKNNLKSITLLIKDNGPGISPEILPQLMQPGASFGKASGSGLGLYHAKTTLERTGGSLAIESRSGQGTTVTLTFELQI